MGTHAIINIGTVGHYGDWEAQKVFYKHYDGYMDEVLPILHDHWENLEDLEEFELLEDKTCPVSEYYYFVDKFTGKCTILEFEWEIFRKYDLDSYRIIKEVIL